MSRIEYQLKKFGFKTESICVDAAYNSNEIFNAMHKRSIKALIPQRHKSNACSNFDKAFDTKNFVYDSEENVYICPTGKLLKYSNYSKKNRRKRYLASIADCRDCPHKEKCIGKSKNPRRIERSLHEKARIKQAKNLKTPQYREAMRLRMIWCEGNFAHQK